MFHPAKVLGIFRCKDRDVKSSDETTQATVEMWDENIFTCPVEKKIADKLKENDVVLVDYGPFSEKMPVAKQCVTKILYRKRAEKLWAKYKEYYRNKKLESTKIQPKSYMG